MHAPAVADLRKCIHCGMCLEACPTYRVTGLETESPRGRIHLMEALLDGRSPTRDLVVHLDRCLACRACESACPSAVPYGRLIESTRAMLAPKRPNVGRLALRWLFAEPRRLRRFFSLADLARRAGVFGLLRRRAVTRLLPRRMRTAIGIAPPARPRFSCESGGLVPARWPARGRVGFLTGCVMRESFGDVHEAAASLLSRVGLDVVVPQTQVCCGALSAHAGDVEGAKSLARRNIDAFFDANVSAIVVDSAGCGAHMKQYGELLADEPEMRERGRREDEGLLRGARAARGSAASRRAPTARDVSGPVSPRARARHPLRAARSPRDDPAARPRRDA